MAEQSLIERARLTEEEIEAVVESSDHWSQAHIIDAAMAKALWACVDELKKMFLEPPPDIDDLIKTTWLHGYQAALYDIQLTLQRAGIERPKGAV